MPAWLKHASGAADALLVRWRDTFVGRQVLRMGVEEAVLGFAALIFAFLGFFWLPAVVFAIPLLIIMNRLDPAPVVAGFAGERHVAQELSKLDDRFRVVHDVDIGRGNVDHVVIGPAGVFAIETKNRRGRVKSVGETLVVNGRTDDAIRAQ